jgi:HK97 family phage prohead protease
LKLTFSAAIEAADSERRIISGKIMEYGATGHTSVGPVVFEKGSISIPAANRIKLLAQHEPNNPIGRAQSFSADGNYVFGTFKISNSSKGTDYLTLAAEDLVSGLSVGVEVIASIPKDNYLLVTAAKLVEVSLVESPAFENATVTKVAASESETVEAGSSTSTTTITTTVTTTETESEDVMTTAPENTAPETAAEAPVVDAARPTTAVPYNALDSQRVRHGITSSGRYLQHKILAAQGNDESKLWITAADDFSSAGLGFTPTQYLRDIVTTSNFGRPAVDAVDKQALPASGMTINRPKFTTYPVATVEAEGGAVQNTDAVSEYLSATVSKYSGMQTLSVELLERSDPGFFDAITRQLELAYLKVTDAAVITALTSFGTAGTTNVTANAAGIIDFISTESPLCYSGSSFFAKNYLCGSSQWSLLLGSTDTTGRPIFTANQPMNAAGTSSVSSIKGNVLGLDLYVDKNAVSTTIDNSAFIIAPEAFTVFESPTAYMSVNVVSNLQVQVAIYGYMATMGNIAAGIRRFNIA